ncbi:MAG: 2-oxo-4-hydroxy-4-carboxy-5-ureidoimidazoline decarboxylase [Tagaea sp.]|nr:2-oxo-4-hydroxy-4-carboxy-5-ureidoimidazoline decarboxylase [Tagaea sp.]
MQSTSTEPHDPIESLNAAPAAAFSARVAAFVENAPWLAARAAQARPFAGPADLFAALSGAISAASDEEKLRLLRGHPELAGAEAQAGQMTHASTGEQARLGLLRLTPAERRRIEAANAAYRARFGFPFIVALHRHATLAAVLADLDARLASDPESELARALAEVTEVTRGRVARVFGPFPPSHPTPSKETVR